MHLLFFPFVGNSSESFHSFDNFLNESIKTVTLEQSGRFTRKDEPVLESIEEVAADLLKKAEPIITNDTYAIFCHSMGVLCCMEFIRQALEKNLPAPVHVFISGRYAPDGSYFGNVDDYTDEGIVNFYVQKGLMQKSTLTDEKLIAEANAILCHDMRMAEKYSEKYVRQPDFFQLPCDITVMYGIKDLLLEYADMNDWKRFTKKECDIISFRGGHFYYRLKKKAVCDIINSRLEKYK